MSDSHDKSNPSPDWVPRHKQRVRWDRALERGDVVFRWHSRLDGTAILYGPAGTLSVGDTVAMPSGHLHRPGDAAPPPVLYVVTHLHEAEPGHVWVRVARHDHSNPRT